MLPEQVSPLWHMRPVQQGCPAAPQAVQVPAAVWLRPLQARPEPLQVAANVPQQGWPSPPQVPHTEPSMQPSAPVQAGAPPSAGGPPLPQQGWPSPPHAAQVPPVNWPAGRAQPRPALQALLPKPLQQGAPEPPQVSQVPALASLRPEQASVLLWQLPPPQQAWPEAPQFLQVPPAPNVPALGLSQPSPALHGVALRQQG